MPASFRETFVGEAPEFDSELLDSAAWARLERLAQASPLYAQVLRRRPSLCLWLEDERNLRTTYRYQALLDEWKSFSVSSADDPPGDEGLVARLRRWRRLMSLRIAHRSVNDLADEPTTVAELSQLAEFCLRECTLIARRRWTERFGEPWDEEGNRPARFCVIALGKLGGTELNFSSDIDLIYCYEGSGACRRDGAATSVAAVEYFTKVAETITTLLTAQTGDGFLFRVDVRLRPEGAWGPLVHSLSAIENYYASAGQTWERLALLKARPVSGDFALGAELLEDLHDFRYPRRPPPSLLAEVAAMKLRTEREIVGAEALERDIKRGPGGIREIEFIAQSLQLLHAGRYPFLQTPSTVPALESLARYELLPREEALFLGQAYWYLRKVEHRLQIRDESQTHELPSDSGELAALASSLSYESKEKFLADLNSRRQRVQALYAGLFSDLAVDREFEAWWEFFTLDKIPEAIAGRMERWFGAAPAAAEALRLFVCGDHRFQVTRELVTRFQHLASNFDLLTPQLADPLQTLARLARCAECYGTRQQFLNACAANPRLLRVLALLCDRSSYCFELLCAHPEILEEVLRPEILRRRKSPRDLGDELALGPKGPGRGDWLWLYVRAEQMRNMIGELLGFIGTRTVETALTQLADAVLIDLLGDKGPLVVALGKYGGEELTFGSDLDLLVVAEGGTEGPARAKTEDLRQVLRIGGPLGPAFAIDLRLRPHGDAGPLVTTLAALSAYYPAPGQGTNEGGAQPWEKQALVRARAVTGPPGLGSQFNAWRERLLYSAPLAPAEETAIWAMRRRIERERDPVSPPERAFKTGAGGLVDIEFLAQTLQLRHGHAHMELRQTGTRPVLRSLASNGLIPEDAAASLLENFEFLKKIEFALRRDAGQGISVLAADPAGRNPLARWLGFPDESSFWAEHLRRLAQTRFLVLAMAGPIANSILAP